MSLKPEAGRRGGYSKPNGSRTSRTVTTGTPAAIAHMSTLTQDLSDKGAQQPCPRSYRAQASALTEGTRVNQKAWASAIVGLLRQDDLSLARRDHFDVRADFHIGELRRGDDLGCERLLVLGHVSGLSILTSTAPAATFRPRSTGISATRPSTCALMSSRIASTSSSSPCTNNGSPRGRYQIDRPATARTTSVARLDAGACLLGVSFGGSGAMCAWVSAVGASIRYNR